MNIQLLNIIIVISLTCFLLSFNQPVDEKQEKNGYVCMELSYFGSSAFEKYKNTCDSIWDIKNIIDSTFEVIVYTNEGYSIISCDGYLNSDEKLYRFFIKVDTCDNLLNYGKRLNDETTFKFPEITNIDLVLYDRIKRTCSLAWDMCNMVESTFVLTLKKDYYIVDCYGYREFDGTLEWFFVTSDIYSTWLNFGNSVAMDIKLQYLDITQRLSLNEFEDIKNFIIKYGDRESYCAMYSNNPHYSFNGFEVYLNPEIGQGNINCDPEISDFNVIVIKDLDEYPQYYYIQIIRLSDLDNKYIFTYEGMLENKVYLLNLDSVNLAVLEDNAYNYLEMIKNEIFGTNKIDINNTEYSIKIYPNSVKEQLKIYNNLHDTYNCKIYNSAGQLLKTLEIKEGFNIYNISDLKTGNYVILIQTHNGLIANIIIKL